MELELEKLGLEEKEAQTYLSCLNFDPPTPSLVAKQTGLKRATVYFYLERMKEKGLIDWEVHKSRKRISVVSPKQGFKRYIAKQKERIEQSEEMVKGILAHIDKMLSSGKTIYWFGSMEVFLSAAGGQKEWYKMFTTRRLEEGAVTCGITDKRILQYPQFSEMKEARRSFRFLENDFEIPAVLALFGDSICLGSKQNNEIRTVLIENPLMAQTLTFLFRSLWSSLSKE